MATMPLRASRVLSGSSRMCPRSRRFGRKPPTLATSPPRKIGQMPALSKSESSGWNSGFGALRLSRLDGTQLFFSAIHRALGIGRHEAAEARQTAEFRDEGSHSTYHQ